MDEKIVERVSSSSAWRIVIGSELVAKNFGQLVGQGSARRSAPGGS